MLRIKIAVLILLPLCFLLCCGDKESGPNPKQTVDPLLVGDWRQMYDKKAFSIDEDGNVTYYRMNQLTGKYIKDDRFRSKIEAINGKFKFVESNNCYTEIDNVYKFKDESLQIPISQGWSFPDTYLPFDVATYVGNIRYESHVKCTIEMNETKFGNSTFHFDSSTDFDLIDFISYDPKLMVPTYIIASTEPDISCNLPNQFFTSIRLVTKELVDKPGVYPLQTASIQLSMGKDPDFSNLSFEDPSYIKEAELVVTNFVSEGSIKTIEGTFNITLVTPEFNGNIRTIKIQDGNFKIKSNMLY